MPFNIFLKIKEKYKGKAIKIVTEVIEEDSTKYSINVEDEENVYVIESNSEGYLHIIKNSESNIANKSIYNSTCK